MATNDEGEEIHFVGEGSTFTSHRPTVNTTPDKKAFYLDRLAPVCYSFTTQEAQQLELLNNTQLVFVQYNLNTVKNIVVKMKNGQNFHTSENDKYNFIQKTFIEAYIN